MNSYSETTTQGAGFCRDADRAVVGGVCAGLAGHFGLNLKVTRFLMILAFLMATPFALIAYIGAVLLIPTESRGESGRGHWRACRQSARSSRKGRVERRRSRRAARWDDEVTSDEHARAAGPSLREVRDRCKTLDRRLAELEKQVTSPRFQLEQEFRKL